MAAPARGTGGGYSGVTAWNPAGVILGLVAAHKTAAIATANVARGIAPGTKTRRAVHVSFPATSVTSFMTARMDALRRGPAIYPIVAGSRPGTRRTEGLFVWGGLAAPEIDHPGTPPHPFLNRAATAFPGLYYQAARRRMRFARGIP